jgi:hypothetical protein
MRMCQPVYRPPRRTLSTWSVIEVPNHSWLPYLVSVALLLRSYPIDARLMPSHMGLQIMNAARHPSSPPPAGQAVQCLRPPPPGRAAALAIGATGACTRSSICTKGIGHPGFCSGIRALGDDNAGAAGHRAEGDTSSDTEGAPRAKKKGRLAPPGRKVCPVLCFPRAGCHGCVLSFPLQVSSFVG